MKTLLEKLTGIALALVLGFSPVVAQAQDAAPDYFRPYGQRGVNMFETPRLAPGTFDGVRVHFGGAFAQQFQALEHSNAAQPVEVDGVNRNELIGIGNGFNLATANLNLDAQLADGITLSLVTYLSSRHHQDAWVKGGFLQVDGAPFLGSPLIDDIFEVVRLRVGHMEINYGDGHFRRSDNGNAAWNPFVESYLMDAFTTEIGGEVYAYMGDFFVMGAFTGGEIQGQILRPEERAPSFYGKVGFDRDVSDDLRVRLTGSAYTTKKSLSNTLYGGDRAGSRYYFVTEAVGASASTNFTSGRVNPGFRNDVTAIMVNPFVKYHGLEVFGLIETATGSALNEPENRTWNQYSIEAIYRFLPREQVYVGSRYNVASGPLTVGQDDVSVSRVAVGAGWFVTPNIMLKAEYVNQSYKDYPATSILHDAKFNGFMVEGVIAF